MFSRRVSREVLEARLAEIKTELASGVFPSSDLEEATQVIVNNEGTKYPSAVEKEFSEKGLPKSGDMVKQQFRDLARFSRLHRERKKIEKKLAKLKD